MKILIACEFSGIVRDAFTKNGHDAWSCDILPTESPGRHIFGDVIPVLKEKWDMIIAFPPCTHLCSSGARSFKEKIADGRQQQGIDFFMMFVNCCCPKIAIENPIGIMSTKYRKPDQIIQPWQFGHPHSKATCLWIKGLPKLNPTNILNPTWTKNLSSKGKKTDVCHNRPQVRWENQTASGQNKISPSKNRWKLRSITYHGIADAMASQWGAP
jgi:hypothetical protein